MDDKLKAALNAGVAVHAVDTQTVFVIQTHAHLADDEDASFRRRWREDIGEWAPILVLLPPTMKLQGVYRRAR